MKLLFVNVQLNGIGGIESSLVNLLEKIHDKYDIDLCLLANHITSKTKLPGNVNVIKGPRMLEYICMDYSERRKDYSFFQGIMIFLCKIYQRVFGMKSVLKIALRNFKIEGEYDVAISFFNDIYSAKGYMGGPENAVLECVDAKKKVAWIHNDARRLGFSHKNGFENYDKFDKIVNVSYACKDIFDEIFPEFAEKSFVVYNLFNNEKVMSLAKEENPYKTSKKHILVTVARLDNRQKRIDKVIECSEMLKANGFSDFEWHIIGDGPDREMLHSLRDSKDVGDVVVFDGYQQNPYKYIKNAELLVMTSDFEAYSMVLTEALALGTPIVCTNYDSASEIVKTGFNGYLTGMQAEDICACLHSIFANPDILLQFRKNIEAMDSGDDVVMTQLRKVFED